MPLSAPFLRRARRTSLLVCCTILALAAGCSNLPPAPTAPTLAETRQRLAAVLPADVLLLGEQHDAAEHQHIHQQVVQTLAHDQRLAALALEMADSGGSTAGLPRDSSETEVQKALQWNDKGWPWQHYGPAVMAAVRAGVPVLGANLPRTKMRAAMADTTLDTRLPAAAWTTQQQAIRSGHCGMLPETQIVPMARIQVAKDISMAHTITQSAQPGKVVVLMAGSGHVDHVLGVPHHLPRTLQVVAVRLQAGAAASTQGAEAPDAFDAVWHTPAVPAKDYCATLRP